MLSFSKIWLHFWTSSISAGKIPLLVKISEYIKYYQTYLEAQFQIENRIFQTRTGIDVPGKGEPVDSEEGNSF